LTLQNEDISETELKCATSAVLSKIEVELKTVALHKSPASTSSESFTVTAIPSNADLVYDKQTVVVLPVLLSSKGSSYSKSTNRKLYMALCFWSIYANFHNIVAYVSNVDDLYYLK
jgi:hypothetical protein